MHPAMTEMKTLSYCINEDWDLGCSSSMEAMGLEWFHKILIHQIDEICENIGQIEENIRKYRASSKIMKKIGPLEGLQII